MGGNHWVSLKGQLLIAMPGLTDPNFSRSVTCICEHTPAGAVGIVINRIHPLVSAGEIFNELNIGCTPEAKLQPVLQGGPVHMGEIFILHGPPFHWEGCMRISDTLALSNTRDILESIALGQGPLAFVIALGCAGWGKDQLESEILANVWLTCPLSEELIFTFSLESRWDEAMRTVGVDPASLSGMAGSA
ncbi:MAG: YqgE/AlgH family protein [Thermodesulfobacteriota bacterium]